MITRFPIWLLLCLVTAYAIFAHGYFGQLDLVNALRGFSILEFLAQNQFPENFERDYPGGAGFTNTALLTNFYIPLAALTGLSGQTLQYMMIGLEVICVTFASLYLFQTLMRVVSGDKTILPLAMIWLVIVLNLSFVIKPDLANFSFPFYHGQFYGFGDAARLMAIAFFLQRRWALTAILLIFGFMIHPIKTLLAGVFIAGAGLADWRRTISLQSILWAFISLFGVGAWAYFILRIGQGGDVPPVPLAEFTAYTRIFQVHWYPFDMGYFGAHYHNATAPFMGLMGVMLLALAQISLPKEWVARLLGGFAALSIVTLAGLWISMDLTSVTLIQICLIRASALMTLLAPFLIIAAMVVNWDKGQWHWVAFYTIFLMAGFENLKFMTPLLFVAGAAFWMWENRKLHKPLAALAALVLIAQGVLAFQNPEASNPVTILLYRLVLIAAVFACLASVQRWPVWARLSLPADRARMVGVTVFFLLCAVLWSYGTRWKDTDYLTKAQDYKNVQIWAEESTDETALFMVDPCITYGWRDFSHRSSIGTPREWFMTGWLYVSEKPRFDRGLAIADSFGLDLRPYLPERGEKPSIDGHDVCQMAIPLYYDPQRRSLRSIARDHGVDYFVFEQNRMGDVLRALPFQYENAHYRVIWKEEILP